MNTNDFTDDACTPVQPKPASQVENQLESIDSKLTFLAKTIGLVEERLSGVLRTDVLISPEEQCTSKLVGLASKLENISEMIMSHDIKLRNILDRLEL